MMSFCSKIPDFKIHLENIYNKEHLMTRFLGKVHNTVPTASLITFYKSFARLFLDYGDTPY